MKERIWVKTDGLRLHHLQRRVPMRGESIQGKEVWASLKLSSAFNINGILIESKSGEKDWFGQGWGNADVRLIDVPVLHNTGEKYTLLMDVLAKAVHDFCLQRAELLRPFIENGTTNDELTLGFFKPEDWQGKSLMIPVDFIRLQNFQLRQGKRIITIGPDKKKVGHLVWQRWNDKVVTADIEVGHHLVFFGVKIHNDYQGLKFERLSIDWLSDAPLGEERIQDKTVNALIKGMFANKEILETISAVAKGTIDMESKFVDKVKGCDSEGIPPPIKFE